MYGPGWQSKGMMTMRAIVQHRYGAPEEVLRLEEVAVPTVGDGQVLVRVRASSANPWDWHFVRGEPILLRPTGIGGIRRPRFPVPGGDVAGTVEEVGPGVEGLAVGDEVYGFGHGAFADFVAVPQRHLALKPANLSFEQAAAVPLAGVTALQGLRAGGLRPGQHVLVIGASGGVGTFAVQLARHLGARVTGVCSTANLGLVRDLGAEAVIDYTTQDLTAGPTRYDLVFQLGGTTPPRALRRVLTPRGTLVQSAGDGSRWLGPVGTMAQAAVLNLVVGQTLRTFVADETTEALDELRELVEAGAVVPVVDRTYPLSDAAAAVRLVEEGRPAGKVVVSVA